MNVLQIILLLGERWPRSLTGPQRMVHQKIFPEVTPGEFVRLMKMGTQREVSAGTQLVGGMSFITGEKASPMSSRPSRQSW